MHETPWMSRRPLAAVAVVLTVGACALFNRDPQDERTPPDGGLPRGIVATPATPGTTPVTSPTPIQPDLTPPPSRQPLGTLDALGEAAELSRMDTTTRQLSARIDTVIVNAETDLTRMSPTLAVPLITSIRNTLSSNRDERVRMVAMELDSLRLQLSRTPIDGVATGRVLRRLGARTQVAASAAGVMAGKVARLADLLRDTGNRLTAAR